MGPGYYVIAILGCGDGSAACTPMATVNQRFESEAACSAAAPEALMANSDLDSPTLIAQCRPVTRIEAEKQNPQKALPTTVRRG